MGLKPTVGLTSRAGSIPLNPEQDSIGPMTRWVKDSALLLEIIAGKINVLQEPQRCIKLVGIVGKDAQDQATSKIPFDKVPNYVAACKPTGLQDMRIAVCVSECIDLGLLLTFYPCTKICVGSCAKRS